MNNHYTAISTSVKRCCDIERQRDPVSNSSGHWDLKSMWKLKIMDTK